MTTVSARETEAAEHASAQLRRLFVAFPSYRNWLLDDSKVRDGVATFGAWARMLSSKPGPILTQAIDRILDGHVTLPEAYARDQLPITILRECDRLIAAANHRASDDAKARKLLAEREAKAGRGGCRFAHSMAELYREGNNLDEAHARGELSDDDHRAAKAAWRDKINAPATPDHYHAQIR